MILYPTGVFAVKLVLEAQLLVDVSFHNYSSYSSGVPADTLPSEAVNLSRFHCLWLSRASRSNPLRIHKANLEAGNPLPLRWWEERLRSFLSLVRLYISR